jgi:hypothetical protein
VRRVANQQLAAARFCAVLAVVHTWPLASAPGTLSRNDNADAAVLAHNLALLAGMALTAFAGCLLALRYTRDAAAGLVAATLVAFNAMTLTSIPHLLGFDLLLAVRR